MPKPIDDSIIGVHEKILLYGLGGSGKTFTAATMPGTVYFIVFVVFLEISCANYIKRLSLIKS